MPSFSYSPVRHASYATMTHNGGISVLALLYLGGALVAFALLAHALAIEAFVTDGRRQAFGIGFTLPAIACLTLTLTIGLNEYRAQNGVLPTSVLLQHILQPQFKLGQSPNSVSDLRQQNAMSVIPLGQLCCASILGYIGGWYGRWSSISNHHEGDDPSHDPKSPVGRSTIKINIGNWDMSGVRRQSRFQNVFHALQNARCNRQLRWRSTIRRLFLPVLHRRTTENGLAINGR